MSGIIDFHTHAFPDRVATAAIPALEAEGNIRAHLDGTVAGLLASMDRAGIDQSVVCSIATRPEQFEPILHWSRAIRSERIIPLPSSSFSLMSCRALPRRSISSPLPMRTSPGNSPRLMPSATASRRPRGLSTRWRTRK